MKIRKKEQNNKKISYKNIINVILIVVLTLIALCLIFNKEITGYYVKHHSEPTTYLKQSKDELQRNADEGNKKGNFDADTAVPVSSSNIVKAAMSNEPRKVIGGISIPELGINLPIMQDSGYYSMFYGAGPLVPNQKMGKGNYVLASHDMWTNGLYYSKTLLFTPLKSAEQGQKIYITNKDKVYMYKIYEVKRVKPSAWDEAVNPTQGKTTITLITCDTDDNYRIMVKGELSKVSDFNDRTAKPFTGEYNDYKN